MDSQKFKEGFFHIFKAAGYSFSGILTGLRLSLAFRQEAAILAVLLILPLLLGKSFIAYFLCVCCWLLVMAAELFNTAIEETLNLITKDFNIGVKYAKDMASAAVFFLLVINALLWFGVFILNIL